MRIHHLALRVADVERAAAFYAGLLGLPEIRRNTEDGRVRSLWLRSGDAVIMLERRLAGAGESTGSGHLLALAIDDLRAWEVTLHQAGVAIESRSEHTLYVRDPDGHRVGLSDYRFEL